jgi:hypothetical protein
MKRCVNVRDGLASVCAIQQASPWLSIKRKLPDPRTLRQAYAAPSTRNQKKIGVIGVTMVADSSLALFVVLDDGIFLSFRSVTYKYTVHTYFRY